MKYWYDIEPKDAVNITLPHPDIIGPLNEMGEPCPWPWEPIQLKGAPLGQYHCPYCGAMVVAGMDHFDYRDDGSPDGPEEDADDPRPEAADGGTGRGGADA